MGFQRLTETVQKLVINLPVSQRDSKPASVFFPGFTDVHYLAGHHFKPAAKVIKADLSTGDKDTVFSNKCWYFSNASVNNITSRRPERSSNVQIPMRLPRLVTITRAATTSPTAVVILPRSVGCMSFKRWPPA